MNITVRQMRKSVKGWLAEERATVPQALMLQSAIEAGAIDGGTYEGDRNGDPDELVEAVSEYQTKQRIRPKQGGAESVDCGCLLDTLERMKTHRPEGEIIAGPSSEAFALAQMIGIGDTPRNSPWAKAAVKGIEDYVATVEAAHV